MKELKQPTHKQASEADCIHKVALLDDIFVKNARHHFIVVNFKVVEDDDVANELNANHQ